MKTDYKIEVLKLNLEHCADYIEKEEILNTIEELYRQKDAEEQGGEKVLIDIKTIAKELTHYSEADVLRKLEEKYKLFFKIRRSINESL